MVIFSVGVDDMHTRETEKTVGVIGVVGLEVVENRFRNENYSIG